MELNKKINLNVSQLIGILETHSSQASVIFDDNTKKFVVSARNIKGTGFDLRTAVCDLADGLMELPRKPRQFVKDLEQLLGFDDQVNVCLPEVKPNSKTSSSEDDDSSIFAPFKN